MKYALVLLALASGRITERHAIAPGNDVAARNYYTYLGDIVPATSTVGWGNFQVNKNWYMEGFKIADQTYETGVFAHAPSSIVYDLNQRFTQFTGAVGLDDGPAGQNTQCKNAVIIAAIEVEVGGKTTVPSGGGPFRLTRRNADKQIQQFSVDVSGAERLTLITRYDKVDSNCASTNKGGEVDWVDAKLLEDPEIECYELGEILPESSSVGWGSYWVNKNWYMNGFMVGGVRYTSGVFAHAKSVLSYNLKERTNNGERKWAEFTYCVGLDDHTRDATCNSQGVDFTVVQRMSDNSNKRWTKTGQQRGDAATCNTLKLMDGNVETDKLVLRAEITGNRDKEQGDCDEAEWVNARVCMDRSMVNCTVNSWEGWSTCTRSCGSGTQMRKRTVDQRAKFGGRHCPGLQEVVRCNEQPCPINCKLGEWTTWDQVDCTRSCGGGKKYRYRGIERHHSYGGITCGETKQEQACNVHPCPRDCTFVVTDNTDLNGYGDWSECSLSCGGGSTTRTRVVHTMAQYGGKSCGRKSEVRTCNVHPCPIDCKLSGWSTYTECSVTCGTGFRIRKRTESISPQHGGKGCGVKTQIDECNQKSCPIDCEVSTWSAAHPCSHTCGSYGTQIRHRSINVYAAYGGDACPHLSETKECGTNPCPVDCLVSTFGDWTTCSKSCGTGEHARRRVVRRPLENGGKACPHLLEMRKCNRHNCPIDCGTSTWGAWSTCSKSCGSGSSTRTRLQTSAAQYGGKNCPDEMMSEQRYCETQACPSDCEFDSWSSWSTCSHSCGFGGRQSRHRNVTEANHFGGAVCPHLNEQQPCNAHECPVDCEVSVWSRFTACSKSCGGGNMYQSREIFKNASFGGSCRPCQGTTNGCQLERARVCKTQDCPIDCVDGSPVWEKSGTCSTTCGVGVQSYTRNVQTPAQHGGKSCGPSTKTEPCTTAPCPVDCVLSHWGPFTQCSSACYSATGPQPTKTRTRSIIVGKRGNGKACPADTQLEQEVPCNEQKPCPVDCELTDWEDWEPTCSRSCGTGIQLRRRFHKNQGNAEGNACGALVDARSCNTQPCPIDCGMTDWSEWSSCSAKCGQGMQWATRSILGPIGGKHGGKACGQVQKDRVCNTQPCGVDCVQETRAVAISGHQFLDCGTCGVDAMSKVHRKIITPDSYGGKQCEADYFYIACQSGGNPLPPCPIDCEYMPWTNNWEACSKSCGWDATRTRRRGVKIIAQHGGAACVPGDDEESEVCHDNVPCPHQCELQQKSDGSYWSHGQCSANCGTGTKTVTAQVVAFDQATACAGLTRQQCNRARRAYFGTCPAGFNQATMTVEVVEKCNRDPCPVDCKLNPWVYSTVCSKTCDNGTPGMRRRTRSIKTAPQYGGQICKRLVSQVQCNVGVTCPEDCKEGEWSGFSTCSVTCGGVGTMTRERNVTQAVGSGRACAVRGTVETQVVPCNLGPCPVDCLTGTWGEWSDCTAKCTEEVEVRPGVWELPSGAPRGHQTRFRSIVQEANHGGSCGALNQTLPCASAPGSQPNVNQACPRDCDMTAFGPWSACSATCGTDGIRTRTRTIIHQPNAAGKRCGPSSETVACNTFACHDLEKVGGGGLPSIPTHSPTVPPTGHTRYARSKHGHVAAIAENTLQAATTSTPTMQPTPGLQLGYCMNGPFRVAVNWHGAGYGSNFCNLCKCTSRYGDDRHHNTRLQCQKKNCDKIAAGRVCKATKCQFVYSYRAQKEIMTVTHNAANAEEDVGSHHRCAYQVSDDVTLGGQGTQLIDNASPNGNDQANAAVLETPGAMVPGGAATRKCVCMCYGTAYLQADQPRLGHGEQTDQDLFGRETQEEQSGFTTHNGGSAHAAGKNHDGVARDSAGADWNANHPNTGHVVPTLPPSADIDHPTKQPTPYPTHFPTTKTPTMAPTSYNYWKNKKKNCAFRDGLRSRIERFHKPAIQTALWDEAHEWVQHFLPTNSSGFNATECPTSVTWYGNMNKFYMMERGIDEANKQNIHDSQQFFNVFFHYVSKYPTHHISCTAREPTDGVVLYDTLPESCSQQLKDLQAIVHKSMLATNGELWERKSRDWM